MGKSPEFLKIFLSEKTLFRGSLSQFKVVWVGKRGIPEDPKVGVIRGISGGVFCLFCLKMFIVIILSKSLKVYLILVRFRSITPYYKTKTPDLSRGLLLICDPLRIGTINIYSVDIKCYNHSIYLFRVLIRVLK
jgi:hypothetical protein